jgi:hypothetical protein
MKAYQSLETKEDCPEERSGEYTVAAFICATCGTRLHRPEYWRQAKLQLGDPRANANQYHPETGHGNGCEYAGKYFDGPLVELREITGP